MYSSICGKKKRREIAFSKKEIEGYPTLGHPSLQSCKRKTVEISSRKVTFLDTPFKPW